MAASATGDDSRPQLHCTDDEDNDSACGIMLNTDFELVFDLDLDLEGKSSCRIDVNCIKKNTCGRNGVCAKARTFHLTKKYVEVRI